MNELENKFVAKIIDGTLAPPTSIDFCTKKWQAEWSDVEKKPTARDRKVYESGLIIDSLLSEIRGELNKLYKTAPKVSYEKLMVSYLAVSNREIKVALDQSKRKLSANLYGQMVSANEMGNSLSLQEISHGCVDGFQLAIRMCKKMIDEGKVIKPSNRSLDVMEFISRECMLSQLYSVYEHLWQCIFWSDYEVEELDKKNKIFSIKQPFTSFEISFENSAIRKDRLNAQKLMMASNPESHNLFLEDKFVVVERKNKKRVAKVNFVRDSSDVLNILNSKWHLGKLELYAHYPEEWLSTDYGHGFCLDEALEVMRCLMLMANSLNDELPVDAAVNNINRLIEFCPRVQVFSLRLALIKATNLTSDKVSKILDFMTFSSASNSDLWIQPLIKIESNEFAILLSALSSPSIIRVAERWFVSFGIDLKGKGESYEDTILSSFNKQLVNNEFISDYDKGIKKKIKLRTGHEEFDLLARVDDLIIIGECKSIVTTDSEISKYRAAQTLHHAGEQVVRKTLFFKENIRDIFEVLGWDFDLSKEYRFAQCILNSSRVFVGHSFEGVPVIDANILSAYFRSKINRLMTIEDRQGKLKDVAWYQLYSNLEELKSNFSTYLFYPPQLSEVEESFEYGDVKLPYISDDSFKIIQTRLVLKPSGPLDRMDREHKFPVFKSKDYEDETSGINLSM